MNLSTGMHACEIDRFRGMRAASIRKDLEDWRFQTDLSGSPPVLYYCEQLPHGTREIVMVYGH